MCEILSRSRWNFWWLSLKSRDTTLNVIQNYVQRVDFIFFRSNLDDNNNFNTLMNISLNVNRLLSFDFDFATLFSFASRLRLDSINNSKQLSMISSSRESQFLSTMKLFQKLIKCQQLTHLHLFRIFRQRKMYSSFELTTFLTISRSTFL